MGGFVIVLETQVREVTNGANGWYLVAGLFNMIDLCSVCVCTQYTLYTEESTAHQSSCAAILLKVPALSRLIFYQEL